MITFLDTKEKSKETEKSLDSQLWHACAGSMVQMPPIDSVIFYFPQGHAEHCREFVDFRKIPKLPPYIPCRVIAIKYMADIETDEVYTKIKLNPVKSSDADTDDENTAPEKPMSFAKTLTQSDANNGGGFSVPRYCAETIFPPLDYSADPPVQTILAKDVHGETWKFRHIYRGTPRRHLLTTGWSAFVNHKKLVAGDSIVFLRAQSGELCVGIRRAKRGLGDGPDSSPGWNSSTLYRGGAAPSSVWNSSTLNTSLGWNGSTLYGIRPDPSPGWNGSTLCGAGPDPSPGWNNSILGRGGPRPPPGWSSSTLNGGGPAPSPVCNNSTLASGNVVIEAMELAGKGKEFEVVYYPRASTPEFCVKSSLVKAAMRIRWCSGMRFKMPFETEDSSRISWFMGTISSVQVADPVRWPDSPWRLLQVTWDEPDLLQNVKHVSPWLVELVATMPPLHLSPFSPPWKKPRHHQNSEFSLYENQFTSAGARRSAAPADAPAGMQGARHARFTLPLPDFHFSKLHSALFATTFPHLDKIHPQITLKTDENEEEKEKLSCLLTMGSSTQYSSKRESTKQPAGQFVLFGQPILTEQQISLSSSGNSSSESNLEQKKSSCEDLDTSLETGHCKVFMEAEDVGRTLDLSMLKSYEELYKKLADMFGTESSEMMNHLLCRDESGSLKPIGNEPFGDFKKTAKRLTILMESGSENVGV